MNFWQAWQALYNLKLSSRSCLEAATHVQNMKDMLNSILNDLIDKDSGLNSDQLETLRQDRLSKFHVSELPSLNDKTGEVIGSSVKRFFFFIYYNWQSIPSIDHTYYITSVSKYMHFDVLLSVVDCVIN
uniref:Uncharacterized protein n=1 Tax=Lactuca sativa TaxID=4236 RepID=A0A9R1W0L4_LACSA|nr:hypothetical protein LSAT_V11C400185210 [Lactuca sativa]